MEQKTQVKNGIRKIIHLDMDAFFASVEQRDHPQYSGKPIAVGGQPGTRSVVSTCSYEARKYGIHSAMPSSMAKRLCPHLIFVPGNFAAYRKASLQINEIFHQYTDLVEPVSIDEAYLDVTHNKMNNRSATLLAEEIKTKIFKKTQLTASAGVSYCKFLAKIASELDKPDGLVVITPDKAEKVLNSLPIGKFHGIGKVTEAKMKKLGIENGADLRQWKLPHLLKYFGKAGHFYYNIVRGIDERPVVTSRIRKSISMERTFSADIDNIDELKGYLQTIAERLTEKVKEKSLRARTLTVKLKYADFEIIQRSSSARRPFSERAIISRQAENLLLQMYHSKRAVRLLGIALSNLVWQEKNNQQIVLPFFNKKEFICISDNDRIF